MKCYIKNYVYIFSEIKLYQKQQNLFFTREKKVLISGTELDLFRLLS